MVLLVGSIYLAVTAESYRRWVTFGVISSLLLLGSIPVAIALILIPRRRAAALVATAQPASPEGLTRPSVLAPGLLLALGAALLLLTIVVGFLWPGP